MSLITETSRLLIRKFDTSDAPFIITLVNTPGWLQFIGDRNIKTTESAESYLVNGPMKSYNQFGFGLYMMCLKQGNTPIGMCGLIKRDTLEHVDLGFALLPEFEGAGYGHEAARGIMGFAKKELSLKHIAAITTKDNTRSIRLLESLGFAFEKTITLGDEDLFLFGVSDF